MIEYEVILVATKEQFHVLNFPLTQMKEFEQIYNLQQVNYKPISTEIQLTYKNNQQKDDRLEKEIQFNSQVINNRTFYTLAKLDELNKRIYLYSITNFQNLRVNVDKQNQEIIVPQQQQNEINKTISQKKYYKHHQEIKSKEQQVELKYDNNMHIKQPSQAQSTKQMSQNEYAKYVFEN